MKAYLVKISGRVQGVCFRAGTKSEAMKLGVSGWVRNLYDGSVEVFMQGEESNVNRLLSWCYQGPPGAAVARVDYETAEPDAAVKGFSVRY